MYNDFDDKRTAVYLALHTLSDTEYAFCFVSSEVHTANYIRNLIINFLDLMKDLPSFVFHGIILRMTIIGPHLKVRSLILEGNLFLEC